MPITHAFKKKKNLPPLASSPLSALNNIIFKYCLKIILKQKLILDKNDSRFHIDVLLV